MKLQRYCETSEAIEKTLPVVNELLPCASPIGAYCLGALCALAWQDRVAAPRSLLEMALTCPSIEQAAELWREYRVLREALEASDALGLLHVGRHASGSEP